MKKKLLLGCMFAFLCLNAHAQTTPPSLTAATNATVDNDFEITFSDDVDWRDSISQIKYGESILPASAYDVTQAGKVILKPSQSADLRVASSELITVSANSFADAIVTQEIHHGEAKNIIITIQPQAPPNNAELLATQPTVKLQDQYDNDCTENNATTINVAASGGAWILGGTDSKQVINGIAEYTDLTAQSDAEVSAATISFSGTGLTTVESNSFLIPAPLSPPQMLASTDATVDGTFDVIFAENIDWQGKITEVYYDDNLLNTGSYNKNLQGAIRFDPSQDANLQTARTAFFRVVAAGYDDANVEQTIEHGSSAALVIVTQPSAPSYNGGVLETQPEVKLQDQYGNDCTNENSVDVTAARGDSGNWTLGGTVTQSVTNGFLSYSDLTASSNATVSNARIDFSANGITTVTSNTFNIPNFSAPPNLTAQTGVTVDGDIEISFTDNSDWRTQITAIKYDGTELNVEAFDITQGNITLKTTENAVLQKAGSFEVRVLSTGFNDATVEQGVEHGVSTSLVITRQPGGPDYNGGELSPQPIVEYRDQYNNVCVGESAQVEAAKADANDWTLGGIVSIYPSNGVVEFTDLTASGDQAVQGAYLQFTSGSLSVASSVFNITEQDTPPELLASNNATVDNSFDITFIQNVDWQGRITEVYYGSNLLSENAYNKNLQGAIRFDPSQDANLQTSGTALIKVVATGYTDATVQQTIQHGSPSMLIIETQPTAPPFNGELLETQPELKLQDQYSNDCTNEDDLEITAATAEIGIWILGGNVTQSVTNGVLSYDDLTASSDFAVSDVGINFSANGLATVSSDLFDILASINPPSLNAQSDADVDDNIEITFTDDADWRGQINSIYYGGEELVNASYEFQVGKLILMPPQDQLLQKVGSFEVRVLATGFNDAVVTQQVQHGASTALVITRQPGAPEINEGELSPQPILEYRDQYGNVCTGETRQIEASKADDGDWTLGGILIVSADNGVVEFTNLTASSTGAVEDAYLFFLSGILTATSEIFDIVDLKTSPSISAAADATVDNHFNISFQENTDWRDSIKQVYWGENEIDQSAYDITQSGLVELMPENSEVLQTAGTNEIRIKSIGYEETSVSQEIRHGVAKGIQVITQPTGPAQNGGLLAQQPEVELQDKYGNRCTSVDTITVKVEKGDAEDWLLEGTLEKQSVSGRSVYNDLTVLSDDAINEARLQFSFTENTVTSDAFAIPVPADAPTLDAASDVTVDNSFDVGYFAFGPDWKSNIYLIKVNGDTLVNEAWDANTYNIIRFYPDQDTLLQKSGIHEITVRSRGFKDADVNQKLAHGAARYLDITNQPEGGEYNGDPLLSQPIVRLLDQYQNECDTDFESTVQVERGDEQDWTLDGTLEEIANTGEVEFYLTTSSDKAISGARLRFLMGEIDQILSDTFYIPGLHDAPALTAAVEPTVDTAFQITFAEDSIWRSRITQITLSDNVLDPESYDKSQPEKITFDPSRSEHLQKPELHFMVITSTGFYNDTIEQKINHGETVELYIEKEPESPINNGEELAQQPVILLHDQYANTCILDNTTSVVTSKADMLDWIFSGNLEIQAQAGKAIYTDLKAESEIAIDSAYLKFKFEKDSVNSLKFIIPVPIIQLIAADSATVDEDFDVTFRDNRKWRDSITTVRYGSTQLADTAYQIKVGVLTFMPEKDTLLQKAAKDTIWVEANGYAVAGVPQEIRHGKTTEMLITNQPIGPEKNGEELMEQPEMQMKDQYKNNCTTDNKTAVRVSKYSTGGENDLSRLWKLGGTLETGVLNGIISFNDLTATSENRVEGVQLLFSSFELPKVVSDSFNIIVPDPPIITPAENANVDNKFEVSFTENATWRSLITDIKYGIRSLEGNFDASVPGIITFDPEMATILQKSDIDSICVYAEGYKSSSFQQKIEHGKAKNLVILKQPVPPETNGNELFRQPVLKLQDQYRNDCITDNETPISASKGDKTHWALTGNLTVVASEGIISYNNLAIYSDEEINGVFIEFKGTGIIPLKSGRFTIPSPTLMWCGQAKANPEIVCMGEKSKITLIDFEGNIQWQKWNEQLEEYQNVEGEISELCITDSIFKKTRFRAKVEKEVNEIQYSNSVTVSAIEPPIADFVCVINCNIVNFDNLSQNITSVIWDFGDETQSVELNPLHTYFIDEKGGEGFVVRLIASNQICPDNEMSQKIFIATGIDELENKDEIIIYPNPNQGVFSINLNENSGRGTLQITNVLGHVILKRQLEFYNSRSEINFDLSNFSQGMYFVTVRYGNRLLKSRLVIH